MKIIGVDFIFARCKPYILGKFSVVDGLPSQIAKRFLMYENAMKITKTRPVFKGNIPMKSGLFVYCINFLKRRDGKPVPCNIYTFP